MMTNISVKELSALLQEKNPIFLVDVRENSEYSREHIEEANLFPASSLNPRRIVDAANGKKIYVICAAGGRSSAAAKNISDFVSSSQLKNKVFNVSGGMLAWKSGNYPVIENKRAPLPLIRQVHIIARLVGCGLMVSGVTGFCGMATILQKLPYNQQ